MKKALLTLLLALTLSFGMGGIASAALPPEDPSIPNSTDNAQQQVCDGLERQVGGSCSGNAKGVEGIMSAVLGVISFIAGFAAVVMIIVAGIKYATSGGDSSKISSAKSTLIYAIVGIIVVAMAQFVVRYVLGQAA